MIKACIFDLDGTLLDTLGSIEARLCEVLSFYGVRRVTREETRSFVGDGAKMLVKRALDADGGFSYGDALLGEITKTYVDGYNSNPYELTVPYGGITEALLALKARGIKLAVLSNKPDATVKQLCDKFFPDTFDLVFGAREGVALKPSVDAVNEILSILGVSASESAYFGDTAVDAATAKNYGAGLNVGVLWGFRDGEELSSAGASVLIAHPSEIINLL